MSSENGFRKSLFKSAALFQIIVGIIAFVCVALVVFLKKEDSLPDYWAYIEPIVGFSTLIAAVFIWYNEKKQEWRESLPKKMHVEYILDGSTYWNVQYAPLTSENDIRSWGQSIAKTILNNKNNIDFKGFEIESAEISKDDQGRDIMLYMVHFYLIQPIEGVEAGSILKFDSSGIAQLDIQQEKK